MLVLVALVGVVNVAGTAMVLVLVTLMLLMHVTYVLTTLVVVVLMIVALVGIVDVAGSAVVLVLVALMDIVCHKELLLVDQLGYTPTVRGQAIVHISRRQRLLAGTVAHGGRRSRPVRVDGRDGAQGRGGRVGLRYGCFVSRVYSSATDRRWSCTARLRCRNQRTHESKHG